jgi:predicted nucleic acid-binding protein
VDSSIWIDYFSIGKPDALDDLITQNLISTNQLILTELIPVLRMQNKVKLINLLKSIECLDLAINWNQIIEFQVKCLRKGISGIGIPDFIIAQNCIQNKAPIFSLDKHFSKMANVIGLEVYSTHFG